MVRTILHLCLVILSEAKDRIKLSEITNKHRHPSQTCCHPVRLRRIRIFEPRVHGPWTSYYHTIPKELTGVEEMLNTQFSICNVQWNSGWEFVSGWMILLTAKGAKKACPGAEAMAQAPKNRKEEIPFAFLFASFAFFAVNLRQ